MKIIVSKSLTKKMRKDAGFWDSLKNIGKGVGKAVQDVGQGVADVYDKARMGWEIGKMEPKPRWQQGMDATMDPNPIYNAQGKPLYVEKDETGKAKIDPTTGKPIPENPYYVPGFRDRINQMRAYTGQGGSLFGLRNSLKSRGKRMTQKAEKAIVQDETLGARIEQALRLFIQGNPSEINRLMQEGLIENESQTTQPATPPVRPGTVPVQSPAQPASGIPPNQQMGTNTGTITGPVY